MSSTKRATLACQDADLKLTIRQTGAGWLEVLEDLPHLPLDVISAPFVKNL